MFAWIRGEETVLAAGHGPHTSQFVAELFSMLWLA